MATEVTTSGPLDQAVQAIQAMIDILERSGPRNPLPGLRQMNAVGRQAIGDRSQSPTEAATAMRKTWHAMARGFSDVIVNADSDDERTRVNREFDQLKLDLTAALISASDGENSTYAT